MMLDHQEISHPELLHNERQERQAVMGRPANPAKGAGAQMEFSYMDPEEAFTGAYGFRDVYHEQYTCGKDEEDPLKARGGGRNLRTGRHA